MGFISRIINEFLRKKISYKRVQEFASWGLTFYFSLSINLLKGILGELESIKLYKIKMKLT